MSIREWLEHQGLGPYADAFEAELVTVENLPDLTEDDLKALGLPLGPRKTLLKAIKTSTTDFEAAPVKPTKFEAAPIGARKAAAAKVSRPAPSPAPVAEAERRQLTVMFCDLVGSTELSTKFDPEILREMMGAYQTAAGAVIDSYDGHVAQYLGDGLMVYFGWPHAHEDDAVRAVQASLEIIEAVKKLDVPTELSVRVGIATGPVVVGETGGGDPSVPKTAVGETPNLAARVQGMAEPDTVAIGGITRGLIGAAFELEGLGSHSLKGIANPIELYRVVGDKGAESRFEATYADHLTPVVGRDSEIALQLDRWQRAKDGEGQVILLSGEPGIGKSRLIHMLREKLAEDTYTPIRYQCSSHHSNSAFYPAIDQLERAAGFTRDDNDNARLDKIESLLGQSTENVDNIARLFASLLSLPTDRYPTIDATPQQLKEQTLTALNDQLLGLASKNPVVFLIEDVQWCDPTTLELIGDAITRIIDARVLLVITYRPEFEAPWTGHAHVSVQTLNRLSRKEGSEVVEKVTGGKSLPKEVLELIVAKTDGIPLYVEELTKNVLEAGFLKDAGDHYELDGPLPALAIPTTLQESLIARLDRLNTVKTIAQIGACIGREFTHELVATVAALSETELDSAFRQLVEAQIILPQGGATQGSYTFKHALLQDAAYDSLLKEPRRQFHDRIADGFISKFPDVVAKTPELLASHLARAERFDEAVHHWREAGLRATRASSNQEAINHFEVALEYLEKENKSLTRDKRELELQTPLAMAMTSLHGHGSPKTGSVYERAFKLTQGMDSPPELFQILYGLSSNRMNSDRFMEGLAIAKELAAYADKSEDKAGNAVAHRWYGHYLFWPADLENAKIHLEKAIAAYEELNFNRWVDEYGQDPKAMGLIYLAGVRMYQGFIDEGKELILESITHAKSLEFPFGLAFCHCCAAIFLRMIYDVDAVETHAEAQLKISLEKNFPWLTNHALIFSGWAQHRHNKPGSFEKIETGINQIISWGSTPFDSVGYHVLAHQEACISSHRYDLARDKIEDILRTIKSLGLEINLPEALRLKGLCTLGQNGSATSEVEDCFQQSLTLAKKHKNKVFEIRTAISFAQFLGETEERQRAYDLLSPICETFTEGLNTPLLLEAEALLNELQ